MRCAKVASVISVLVVTLCVAAQAWGQKVQFVGAGGCSGANCHGGTAPADEKVSRILTTEYALWSISDKHSRAAKVLEDPRAKRMAEILGIQDALTDRKCASCHVAGSPERLKSDGVACEACHGPAAQWLGTHIQQNSHANSVAQGMSDTKNLRVRAKMCLGCHLGGSDWKVVDHELIAAGHPDLAFELETFSFAQPAHYRDLKPSPGNTLPKVRLLAVGQATALAEGMRLLAEHATNQWPEFSDLDCYQCHHDLRAESWRIQRGYAGRRPGSIQMNLARTDVFRIVLGVAAEQHKAAVETALASLTTAVSRKLNDGPAIAAAAREVAQHADRLAAQWETMDFTPEIARTLARSLTADIGRIAGSGAHSAEQATMALDALVASYAVDAQTKGLAELYTYLEHPSAYNAREFANLFRRVASQFP